MIEDVVNDLLTHYKPETPVAVVQKASWPDEKIVKGKLNDISNKVQKSGINKTAMIIVGDVLEAKNITPSKLYDRSFTHEYRNGE